MKSLVTASTALTLRLLGNFACVFLTAFFRKFLQEYLQSVKQFGFSFRGPDLDPNCLQILSADGTSRQRVNLNKQFLPKISPKALVTLCKFFK